MEAGARARTGACCPSHWAAAVVLAVVAAGCGADPEAEGTGPARAPTATEELEVGTLPAFSTLASPAAPKAVGTGPARSPTPTSAAGPGASPSPAAPFATSPTPSPSG